MSNGQEGNNNDLGVGQASPTAATANSAQYDADFGTLSTSKAMVPTTLPRALTLNSMLDVPVPIVFEVGRTKITIAHLMELREGSFIDLRNMSVDVIDMRVDEQIIAEAEAISLQHRYGVRVSEVTRLPSAEDIDDAS